MNVRSHLYFALALAVGAVGSGVSALAGDASPDAAAEIKAVIETNMAGINQKNVDLAMSAFHSKSPNYVTTKRTTQRIFHDYNPKVRLVSCVVIGADADYCVARVRFETRQDTGPAFHSNRIDSMEVFRKESGKWKLWASTDLETTFLD
jgi:hypothetical protein